MFTLPVSLSCYFFPWAVLCHLLHYIYYPLLPMNMENRSFFFFLHWPHFYLEILCLSRSLVVSLSMFHIFQTTYHSSRGFLLVLITELHFEALLSGDYILSLMKKIKFLKEIILFNRIWMVTSSQWI